MGTGHHHHARAGAPGDSRLGLAVAANMALTLVQIVAGILSGSLALIADAIHNLSDAGSLLIALFARRIARRPADKVMTFGYGRAEVIAALVNYTTLIMIGIYLVAEAAMRLAEPQPVHGWTVVVVAGVALAVDLVTAALTYAMSKRSMNVRAAFLHNVADALGSLGVIAAGTVIILFGWTIADSIVTFLIAGYVLYHGLREIGGSIRLLMGGAPEHLDIAELKQLAESVEGVRSMHHIHLWQLTEERPSLEAHLTVEAEDIHGAERLKNTVKELILEEFAIDHVTLEIELPSPELACAEGQEEQQTE